MLLYLNVWSKEIIPGKDDSNVNFSGNMLLEENSKHFLNFQSND